MLAKVEAGIVDDEDVGIAGGNGLRLWGGLPQFVLVGLRNDLLATVPEGRLGSAPDLEFFLFLILLLQICRLRLPEGEGVAAGGQVGAFDFGKERDLAFGRLVWRQALGFPSLGGALVGANPQSFVYQTVQQHGSPLGVGFTQSALLGGIGCGTQAAVEIVIANGVSKDGDFHGSAGGWMV